MSTLTLPDGTEVDTDQPATHCKMCGRGIFPDQPRTWQTRPMGLSHTSCSWAAANPSIGHRVTEEAIASALSER